MRTLSALVSSLLMLALPGRLTADPVWWSTTGTSIWKTTPTNTENYALINLGQLKHVATQANRHLDLRLGPAGGAGPVVTAMCQFTQADNAAPATVGQLKNVAKVFYDRLAAVGYNWQTGAFGTASTPYPWPGTTNPQNQSPCNIGQLKNVFSFEMTDGFLTLDTDGDGIPSWWEYVYSLNPSAGEDSSQDVDSDQLTSLEEYQSSVSLGFAFNPRNSHSFGAEWTDYEQTLLTPGGQNAGAVAALRGSDAHVLRNLPLYGSYRRGVETWRASQLRATGEGVPPWQPPIVGDAEQWLVSPSNPAKVLRANSPTATFEARADFLPAWPDNLPDSGPVIFYDGFPSQHGSARGDTVDVLDPGPPGELRYSYVDLGSAFSETRIWLKLTHKVNFPVSRSFHILSKTRYFNTTMNGVSLPTAPADELRMETLMLSASPATASGGTPPPPAVAGPILVAPRMAAANVPRVKHTSSAIPFRFVFYAYPPGEMEAMAGAPAATESVSTAYLPVRLNENFEQDRGNAGAGQPPPANPMPDIDRNRADVAATGSIASNAFQFDRDFVKLSMDASNLPPDEVGIEITLAATGGTQIYLYDDQGRAIPSAEL